MESKLTIKDKRQKTKILKTSRIFQQFLGISNIFGPTLCFNFNLYQLQSSTLPSLFHLAFQLSFCTMSTFWIFFSSQMQLFFFIWTWYHLILLFSLLLTQKKIHIFPHTYFFPTHPNHQQWIQYSTSP